MVSRHMWLLLSVPAGLIFVITRLSKRSARTKRDAVLRAMGLVERQRDEVFEHADALAYIMSDRPAARITNPVAVGRSVLGETAIFEFESGSGDAPNLTTVVAVRAQQGVPDLQIEATPWLDEHLNLTDSADIDPPAELKTYDRHTHQWVGPQLDIPVLERVRFQDHAAFEKKFRVWSADAAAMVQLLTPAARSALIDFNDPNLRIVKRLGWLLMYRSVYSSRTNSDLYPAALARGAELLQSVGLNPSPSPEQFPSQT